MTEKHQGSCEYTRIQRFIIHSVLRDLFIKMILTSKDFHNHHSCIGWHVDKYREEWWVVWCEKMFGISTSEMELFYDELIIWFIVNINLIYSSRNVLIIEHSQFRHLYNKNWYFSFKRFSALDEWQMTCCNYIFYTSKSSICHHKMIRIISL